MDINRLLEQFKSGEISKDEVLKAIKKLPFDDIGIAKIDYHRQVRSGYPEVVFGLSKTKDQIKTIVDRIIKNSHQDILITRTNKEVYRELSYLEGVNYFDDGKIIHIKRNPTNMSEEYVVIISGGTGDIPVCKEAKYTLDAMGVSTKEIYDAGVCGVHRMLAFLDELQNARAIIVAAGMEGALASVVAGVTSCPVIGVPTSVGYGANFGGVSALLSMVNSCANRVSVVNIDNGYGAACVAASIVRGDRN